jgi:O-methyltransferase
LTLVDVLTVSLEEVKGNFARFGLLDDQVRFLKGWFCDTMPTAPIERLAILRLDGDLYSSTMDVLRNLYDRVSPGGYVIVDDYYSWESCRRAVSDFVRETGIDPKIEKIDGGGAFWKVEAR